MTNLIGSVNVTPPQAAPGQSVQVQVLDPGGTPYAADSNVVIALDGIPVPSRYYQFPAVGTYTIAVYAAGNGVTETATATVNITGQPLAYHRTLFPADGTAPGLIPFIALTQDLTMPYRATFSLTTPPAAAAAAARELAAADKANTDQTAPAATSAQKPPAGYMALRALFSGEQPGSEPRSGQHLVPPEPVILPPASTSYIWAFGDGQTATTDTPTVVHDYFPAITPGRVPFAFDVQCQIVQDSISVTRTLVLYSPYGMCQRGGVTVPNVTSDIYATLNSDSSSFSASLLVYNIEASAIIIDQIAIVAIWNDVTASFPFAFQSMAQPITVAPQSSSLLAVQVSRNDLSVAASGEAVTGFIVAFQGTLAVPLVLPSVDVALRNQLSPGENTFSTVAPSVVQFSRHVRLHLQDQQLPPPTQVSLHPNHTKQLLLENLRRAPALTGPAVRNETLAVDSAANVVSVALPTVAPTAGQAAKVRHSVLPALNALNIAGETR